MAVMAELLCYGPLVRLLYTTPCGTLGLPPPPPVSAPAYGEGNGLRRRPKTRPRPAPSRGPAPVPRPRLPARPRWLAASRAERRPAALPSLVPGTVRHARRGRRRWRAWRVRVVRGGV